MCARKNSSRKKSSKAPLSVREGGTHLRLYNSGNEVWLYDDANADAIRAGGGMNFLEGTATEPFESLTKRGLIVGYSLEQDDELEIAVYLGAPLTHAELGVSRWLEPQTAFLRLPSGHLCVEPNDSLRVGAESPTDTGGLVEVPAGDYRVTLYRVDREALFREKSEWKGPQEVIVLTPDGTDADAAHDLLPFESRRDTTWKGKYEITGNRATALAWFNDYWDTCVLNLDSAAAAKLSLEPGSFIRTHVPAAGVTLISAFGASWKDAARLRPPTGVPLDEYGYAAFSPMAEWDGAEALFCRREKATTRIEDEHHAVWIPVTVEVLDPAAYQPAAPQPKVGTFTSTDLATKSYFEHGFLPLILSDVLPGAEDLDDLMLPDALIMFDRAFAKSGLAPQGDLEWEEQSLDGSSERAGRLYTGLPDAFIAIMASEASIDVLVISELDDGRWIVTGLADDFESRLLSARNRGISNEGVEVESIDEALKTIFSSHKKSLRAAKAKPVSTPTNIEEAAATLQRFLAVALG